MNKPNYGLDAPPVIRNLIIAGIFCLILALISYPLFRNAHRGLALSTFFVVLFSGLSFLITALAMIWSSKRGKLLARERLINSVNLRGQEIILDVGCGRGLLLNHAARKLSSRKAIGLDLWRTEDQSGNDSQVTLANARLEGVADKVEVRSDDMRAIPFPDESIDVVVSSIAIHNIAEKAGREKAIGEISRVLRPMGKVALVDFRYVKEYAAKFFSLGWKKVEVSLRSLLIFPPVRVLTAVKPE